MDAGELLNLLGNENRRRILNLISQKPCYVTEISEHLEVSPKAVIGHLRMLEESGLIVKKPSEIQNDNQRRKYFHIAQNMRLEVTVSPYKFGMKRAYPARHSLDISSCQHISLTMPITVPESHPLENISTFSDHAKTISSNITTTASQLRELREIEKELSIAQRWVHGKIITLLDNLSSSLEGSNSIDASILLALSKKDTMHADDISRTFNISPLMLFERLELLENVGLINKTGESTWRLN